MQKDQNIDFDNLCQPGKKSTRNVKNGRASKKEVNNFRGNIAQEFRGIKNFSEFTLDEVYELET